MLRFPGYGGDQRRGRGAGADHDDALARQVEVLGSPLGMRDTFGKFPGTVPSVFIMNYVQAHHLDLDFYDRFFKPGAYLRTHAEHMQRWHAGPEGG